MTVASKAAPTTAISRTREVLDTLRELGVSQGAFARYTGLNPTTISRWANYVRHEEGTLKAVPSRKTGLVRLPHFQEAPYWAWRLVRLLKAGAALDEVRDA